jgi:hypothetical protein
LSELLQLEILTEVPATKAPTAPIPTNVFVNFIFYPFWPHKKQELANAKFLF